MEVKLENLTGLLKILSWPKILQLAMLVLILAAGYGFWENRVTVYNSLRVSATVESDGPLIIELSQESKAYIDNAVVKSKDTIAGIQILSIDFKKNLRSTSYFSIIDPKLQTSYTTYLESRVSEIPMFTDNEANNQRIINLINGEFVCVEGNSITESQVIKFDKSIVMVCSISIPPYYGRFSGYMNVFLLKKADDIMFTQIRQIARDISNRVYESDIDKIPKYRVSR